MTDNKGMLKFLTQKWVLLAILSTLLCGCKVGPDYHSPAAPTAKRYTSGPQPTRTTQAAQAGSGGAAQHFIKGRDIPGQWWTLFRSKQLNRLIEIGIQNSPNLAAAKAALEKAREDMLAQVGASYYPTLDANFEMEKARISGLLFDSPLPNSTLGVYNPSLQASYLIDAFGGQRRLVESFAAEVDYRRYQVLAAYLSLTSNIATDYITIATLQTRIAETKKLIATQAKIYDITQQREQAGGSSKEQVIRQKLVLARTESTLPPLQRNLAKARHALIALVGKLPSELPPRYFSLDTLHLPTKLPISLPSKLVLQRPDIQSASALLHAACAKIGVTKANLYPQLQITASIGWISKTLKLLFNPVNNIWDYGLQIAQPLFRGGELRAKNRAAMAAYKEALAEYRRTVIHAFKNVSDALRFIEYDAKEFKAQHNSETYAKLNLDLVKNQYRVGGKNLTDVQEAEKTYREIKLDRIIAQGARYSDTAALFQALGGGWWNNPIREQAKLPRPAQTTATKKGAA